MKDKTFILGDYESVRQSKSQSANVNVPSAIRTCRHFRERRCNYSRSEHYTIAGTVPTAGERAWARMDETLCSGVNFDFTVLKDTVITERLRLQFRAKFFNIFNHANFQAPNIDAGTSTIGFAPNPIPVTLTQTATEGRDIQFGLKLIS